MDSELHVYGPYTCGPATCFEWPKISDQSSENQVKEVDSWGLGFKQPEFHRDWTHPQIERALSALETSGPEEGKAYVQFRALFRQSLTNADIERALKALEYLAMDEDSSSRVSAFLGFSFLFNNRYSPDGFILHDLSNGQYDRAFEALEQGAQDDDYHVRFKAIRAFSNLFSHDLSKGHQERAIQALERAYEDEDDRVVVAPLGYISWGDLIEVQRDRVIAVLERATKRHEDSVRSQAFRAFHSLLAHDWSKEQRQVAYEALARGLEDGNYSAIYVAQNYLHFDLPQDQVELILKALVTLAQHDSCHVRQPAYHALGNIFRHDLSPEQLEGALEALEEGAMTDTNAYSRGDAFQALERFPWNDSSDGQKERIFKIFEYGAVTSNSKCDKYMLECSRNGSNTKKVQTSR